VVPSLIKCDLGTFSHIQGRKETKFKNAPISQPRARVCAHRAPTRHHSASAWATAACVRLPRERGAIRAARGAPARRERRERHEP
jgi:hypothetical protein